MSLTSSCIPIPIEESLIGVYAKKCNHTLTELEYGYTLTDNKSNKKYGFTKISIRFPEDVTKQISENYNKHKEEDKLKYELKQIIFEPNFYKRRKLVSKRYIKENLK